MSLLTYATTTGRDGYSAEKLRALIRDVAGPLGTHLHSEPDQFYALSSSAALRNVRRVRLNPDTMRQPQPTTESTRLDESGSNVGVAYRSLRAPAQAQIEVGSRLRDHA